MKRPRIIQPRGRATRRQAASWPALIGVDFDKINYTEGIRAVVAVAAMVAAAEATGWPALNWGAVAAFWTCLVDPGGPIKGRLPIMLAFAAAGAALSALGPAVAHGGFAAALPFTFVMIAVCAMLRVYGNALGQMGTILGTALTVALARPAGDPRAMAEDALIFVLGSAWAMLFGLLLWRLHPYLPIRRSTAAVYNALADLAADLRDLVLHPAYDRAAWEAHGRLKRRQVREAIETARQAMLGAVRLKGPIGDRPERQVIFLEAADQIFAAFIGLSDILERALESETDAAIAHRADALLRRIALALLRFAEDVLEQNAHSHAHLVQAIEIAQHSLAAAPPRSDGTRSIDHLASVVIDRMRTVAGAIGATEVEPRALLTSGGRRSLRERVLGPLGANFSLASLAARHALRAAATVTLAEAIVLQWHLPYGYWLTLTAFVIMQPDFSGTWLRALERIAGTVVGAGLCALIGLWLRTPLALTIAVFPLAMATMALRTVNYSLFSMCLTPLFILVVDLGQTDTGAPALALIRAGNSLLGGVIAILGSLLLWPSWEPERLPKHLAAAIAAHGAFADAVLATLVEAKPQEPMEAARRQAGLASNNMEAAVRRALLEPHIDRRRIDAALVVVAALRRIAGALTALSFEGGVPDDGLRRALQHHRPWILGAMAGLAAAVADGPAYRPTRLEDGAAALPPTADPGRVALARIVGQIELMAGALSPLAEKAAP